MGERGIYTPLAIPGRGKDFHRFVAYLRLLLICIGRVGEDQRDRVGTLPSTIPRDDILAISIGIGIVVGKDILLRFLAHTI